jgi:Transposase, Mutator family
LGKGVSRTNALEALVLSGFVRGLSVRDVEAALAEALGPEAALSKSTVSRVCEAIKTEFDAWKLRDLGGIELEYLFLDGSHFRMHPGARAEPVLCAWGITTQGTPLLVGLAAGAHEGHDPWASFLGELVERGLRAPLLVITDGAPGLIGAVELVLANSLRQRVLSTAPGICWPRSPRPGRGQGRVLADLRRHHRRARRGCGRPGPQPGARLRRPLPAALPRGGRLPDRHPARADLLPALSA